MDLCQSLGPLFSRAQWFALKSAGSDRLDELERLCGQQEILMPYIMVQHVRLIYGSLNNDLLLRLIWQAFLFYQAPFLSLPENMEAFEESGISLLDMIGLCRRKDWDGLWQFVASYQQQLISAISCFYANRITMTPPGEPVSFSWNAYQNSSQRCYSIAINLLKGIRLGIFAQDGFLPSPTKIAEDMQVSAITVRRTLTLLNQLGVTKSINGVGTKVLNTKDSAKNCDFTQPVIRKRLLDFIQSLQILAMTCGSCAKSITMVRHAIGLWKDRLRYTKENDRYDRYGNLLSDSKLCMILSIRGMVLYEDGSYNDSALKAISRARENLAIVKPRFLGDQQLITDMYKILDETEKMTNEVQQLVDSGSIEEVSKS